MTYLNMEYTQYSTEIATATALKIVRAYNALKTSPTLSVGIIESVIRCGGKVVVFENSVTNITEIYIYYLFDLNVNHHYRCAPIGNIGKLNSGKFV